MIEIKFPIHRSFLRGLLHKCIFPLPLRERVPEGRVRGNTHFFLPLIRRFAPPSPARGEGKNQSSAIYVTKPLQRGQLAQQAGDFFVFLLIIILSALSGCSTTVSHYKHHYYGKDCAPDFNIDVSKIPDAVPQAEPLSKYGNPASYTVNGHRYCVLKSATGYCQTGIASWYGMKFYKVRTSSGELYDVAGMTAASKVLPLPTYVQVTNLQNHKKIIVKVNDRGPFHENRIIDLSYVAARKLGMFPKGTALVEVRALDPRHPEEAISPAENITTTINPVFSKQPEIYLQLGAFRDQSNATRLEAKVKLHTQYPVLIKTADKNNLPIYRVQIGPIPTVDNTDDLHDTLENAGLGEPITVIQ